MDGALIATIITSSIAVGGAIGGGFWKLGRAIGRLEGKVGGLDARMHSYEKQLEGFDRRIDRLDKRINGFLDSSARPERKEG